MLEYLHDSQSFAQPRTFVEGLLGVDRQLQPSFGYERNSMLQVIFVGKVTRAMIVWSKARRFGVRSAIEMTKSARESH